MTTNESSIINNDSALPIPRQFARWLGWNEAGILQQLHWHTQEGHGQMVDGVRWIRMSETEWLEEIPLDEKAIQRAIKNLVEDGLIKAAVFSGRCKWYTVCYDAVDALSGPVERITQKSEKRKQARATRKDAKEQNVPIEVKEQNDASIGTNCRLEWVQNVPLQETLQEPSKDLLLLTRTHDEILDKIGRLCKTNFFNPNHEPGHTALVKACQDYTAQRVLWAIELALSPEKANGKPKTWGFVLGILEKDKDGSYQAQRNGTTNGQPTAGHRQTYKTKQNGRTLDPRAMDTTAIEREIADLERKLGARQNRPDLSPG